MAILHDAIIGSLWCMVMIPGTSPRAMPGSTVTAPWRARAVLLAVATMLTTGASLHAARGEDQAPAGAAPAAVPVAAKVTAAPRPDCPSANFRMAVDVGHTLDAPGALSARGVTEYAFNLQLAQNIKQALVGAGFAKTELLITDKKPPLGLFDRAAAANRTGADLFLSVHHDSVPDNLIKTWQYEGQDEGYNDDYRGYALFVSKDNAEPAGSLQFGHLLGKALQTRGVEFTPHYTLKRMGSHRRELLDADGGVYRFDQLVVLRYTHMPAVLLEAGSIVNRQEELELATPERRAATSAAVVSAVEDFCAERAHSKTERLAKRPAGAHARAGMR